MDYNEPSTLLGIKSLSYAGAVPKTDSKCTGGCFGLDRLLPQQQHNATKDNNNTNPPAAPPPTAALLLVLSPFEEASSLSEVEK